MSRSNFPNECTLNLIAKTGETIATDDRYKKPCGNRMIRKQVIPLLMSLKDHNMPRTFIIGATAPDFGEIA